MVKLYLCLNIIIFPFSLLPEHYLVHHSWLDQGLGVMLWHCVDEEMAHSMLNVLYRMATETINIGPLLHLY